MKSINKQNREKKVLLGLVDYYIRTGKPVGSHSLQEDGFADLSSATIRNYFAHFEKEGYVTQAHSSGGRIPTDLAYRLYATSCVEEPFIENLENFSHLRSFDAREIALFLQKAAEILSNMTQCAVCLSAPRFDHDCIIDIKLIALNHYRCLCAVITDFGVVRTEILYLPSSFQVSAIQRIEKYFAWRLRGGVKEAELTKEEEELAQTIYHEVMLRYLVGYSTFIDEDIYRTGFSTLLTYSDFQDAAVLMRTLALFENSANMRKLLKECRSVEKLKFWIGNDLTLYSGVEKNPPYSVIANPYTIHQQVVGAVALIGPTRLPYRTLFNLLRDFAAAISYALTQSIYKFKINFREPEEGKLFLQKEEHRAIGQSRLMLLEDKR